MWTTRVTRKVPLLPIRRGSLPTGTISWRKTKVNTTQLFMFIEKRNQLRFPLNCEISFQVVPCNGVAKLHGVGSLIDVSSKAVSFRTETDLPPRIQLQIAIPWPACLANGCTLKLVVSGSVMRKCSKVVVVSMDWHEFRTRGNSSSALRVTSEPRPLFLRARLKT